MSVEKRYQLRGVSAEKEDIHNAIKNLDKGLYPNAFCKIIPDVMGGDDEYCNKSTPFRFSARSSASNKVGTPGMMLGFCFTRVSA